jgi:hypothetical protein
VTGDFDALFDTFTHSAHRVEARPSYAIPAEDPSYTAFLEGSPRPERSVRTSPWLRRIAVTTAAGKTWSRTRVVDSPLTDYQRFEIAAYLESQAAGEQIRVVRRDQTGHYRHPDFWLFDEATEPWAIVLQYGEAGEFEGYEVVHARDRVNTLRQVRRTVDAAAVALTDFLAGAGRG